MGQGPVIRELIHLKILKPSPAVRWQTLVRRWPQTTQPGPEH